MKRTLISAVLVALLTTACASEGGTDDTTEGPTTTTSPTTTPPGDGGDVLLLVEDEGGFAPIEFVINRPPTYVLLNNGTLISQGPQVGAFPGPVMPAMQQIQLSPDQMEDIRVLIEASGLPTIDDVVNNDAANFVADATSTVMTYTDPDGGTHRISVYALGLTMNEPLPDDLANLVLLREKLAQFVGEGGSGEPYATDVVQVRIVEGGGFAEIDDTRPWEFDFAPGDVPLVNGFGCLVLEGAPAEAMKTLMADVTQATTWEHESGQFMVLARELMPGETGCQAQ